MRGKELTFDNLRKLINGYAVKKQLGSSFKTLEKKLIPLSPQEFYECLGAIYHPRTHKPVLHLTPYQELVWKNMLENKYVIVIKSQKIGLTTSVLMADFQFAILPSTHSRSCRGKEILVIAQSLDQAREHLYTLRKMILESNLYREFLITKPTDMLRRDEVSKVTMLYIKNPDNPNKPTRIIGLGAHEGAVWSWKEVKHVHMSDIAAADIDYTGTINAALTRLANTGGTMVIETPPRGPKGRVYEIWQKSLEKSDPDNPEGQFYPIRIKCKAALTPCKKCTEENEHGLRRDIDEPVITEQQLVEYKKIFGLEFSAYFQAEFVTLGGNVFELEDIERAEILGRKVDFTRPNFRAPKSMGVDPGFGSSHFSIVVTQQHNGMAEVIFAQEYGRGSPSGLLETAYEIWLRYGINRTYIDGSNAGYVRDFKLMIGESIKFEDDLRYCASNRIEPDMYMRVIPKNFGREGKEMLAHAQAMLHAGHVAIPSHELFQPLLREMRSAIELSGNLDKTKDTMDSLDALRLALCYYRY